MGEFSTSIRFLKYSRYSKSVISSKSGEPNFPMVPWALTLALISSYSRTILEVLSTNCEDLEPPPPPDSFARQSPVFQDSYCWGCDLSVKSVLMYRSSSCRDLDDFFYFNFCVLGYWISLVSKLLPWVVFTLVVAAWLPVWCRPYLLIMICSF